VRYDLEGTYAGIYQRIVRSIEDLKLAPYDLETYKADPKAQDAMLVGRGRALIGIFKSRYLKRLESSVAAFRISVFRLMEYLLTFRHYILGNVLLEPTDFWKLLGTIERDLEDDAQAQEHAEEDDDDEERSIAQPRSRHAEIEAHPKAAALLQRANRLPPQTYDIQRLIQRAGRIDRIGTDFDTLFIHNFFPDAGLERLLGLVQSLQTKIRQIDDVVGLDASVLGEAIKAKVTA
jgi:hypothetical protein